MKKLLLLCCLLGLLTLTARLLAQDGDYETLRHVVTDARIRATPIIISKDRFVAPNLGIAMRPTTYPALKRIGVNGIRLCWVGPWFDYRNPNTADTWTIDEVAEVMDSVINMATREEIMVIINYHSTGEYNQTQGFGRMVPFWDEVAARYADNEFVIYELANEQDFDHRVYLSPAFRNVTRAIYQQVRRDAPERQIILFSWNAINKPMKAVADDYSSFVDWDFTSVGWHFYGGQNNQQSNEERNLIELMENYRSICTEWDYFRDDIDDRPTPTYIKPFFGNRFMAHNCENFGISWVDWRGWNDATFNEWNNHLLPDAEAMGYAWDNTVSLRDFRDADFFNIYPNPTGTTLTIQTTAFGPGGTELEVYDLAGRLLQSERVSGPVRGDYTLDVRGLRPGQYVLAIRGERSYAKRFVRL